MKLILVFVHPVQQQSWFVVEDERISRAGNWNMGAVERD
jgi:hypothetical protein